MIGTGYLALGGALALGITGVGGFFYGKDVGEDSVRAELAAKLEKEIERRHAAEVKIAGISVQFQEHEIARQSLVREIYREVPRVIQGDPVYRDVCITGDGVQLIDRAAAVNAAVAGTLTGGPGTGADDRADGDGERADD